MGWMDAVMFDLKEVIELLHQFVDLGLLLYLNSSATLLH